MLKTYSIKKVYNKVIRPYIDIIFLLVLIIVFILVSYFKVCKTAVIAFSIEIITIVSVLTMLFSYLTSCLIMKRRHSLISFYFPIISTIIFIYFYFSPITFGFGIIGCWFGFIVLNIHNTHLK